MDRKKLQAVVANNSHFTPSRKVSLFSNFARLEETNPDGYLANVDAWEQVLEDAVRAHAFPDRTCIYAGPELTAKLADVKNGIPLSLNCVIDSMVANKKIVPLSEFIAKQSGVNSGVSSYITRAAGWALGFLWGSSSFNSAEESGSALKQEKYVDIATALLVKQELLSALKNIASSGTSSTQVFDLKRLNQVLPDDLASSLTETDIYVCFALASDAREIYLDQAKGLAKLSSAGPISEIDENVLMIGRQIEDMYAREKQLDGQIGHFDVKAREAVKQGNRLAAKLLLQKKNMSEKSRDNAIGTIAQLESVLQKIDEASTNKQTYAALQASSEILKRVNTEVSVEDVDGVVEAISDEMATTAQVSEQLAGLNIDDDNEVDDELEQMARDEEDKRVQNMPSVPKHRLSETSDAVEPPHEAESKDLDEARLPAH